VIGEEYTAGGWFVALVLVVPFVAFLARLGWHMAGWVLSP
jgi:hypothetical protein